MRRLCDTRQEKRNSNLKTLQCGGLLKKRWLESVTQTSTTSFRSRVLLCRMDLRDILGDENRRGLESVSQTSHTV